MRSENVREKYIEELIKEVLGPRNGSEETIIEADPYTEYITGVIIPKDCKQRELGPESEILNVEGDDRGAEDTDHRKKHIQHSHLNLILVSDLNHLEYLS